MYCEETPESTQIVLNEQLECDRSGELRDRLSDELHVAAAEIEAALGGKPDPAQVAMLRELLEAAKLGDRVLGEVWKAFHG